MTPTVIRGERALSPAVFCNPRSSVANPPLKV